MSKTFVHFEKLTKNNAVLELFCSAGCNIIQKALLSRLFPWPLCEKLYFLFI